MSKIIQMDHKLANMIAAGEVVDRPASIIKELVENAIDAKATEITIEVNQLGMHSVIVTDNGEGMDEIDAKMAFFRHATSKIKSELDLNRIATLGFRGEALAAIAAVSKIKLETKQENGQGFLISLEEGKILNEGFTPCNKGTKITVQDLFYNTPARFKYIKSEMAEKNSILEVFDHMALSNAHIRFTLIMDQQLIKQTYGDGDLENLIAAIYGAQVIKGMHIITDEFQKIKFKAYLVSPQMTRAKKKDIHFFVNGRYIKNYLFVQSVIDGYHGFLMQNRYPMAFIYMEMDPSLLDVNVHPQKLEVKFVNESLLKYHIEQFIKNSWQQKVQPIAETLGQIRKSLVLEETDYKNHHEPPIEHYSKQTIHFEEEKIISPTQSEKLPDFEYVGSFFGTYLLFQNEQGLYMMDQHAAAERIRYEYYYEVLANPTYEARPLLLSYQLNITKQDEMTLAGYQQALHQIGFLFDEHMQLTQVPIWLKEEQFDIAITAIIEMLLDKKQINMHQLRDQLAKDISCKGAIKANKALSRLEIDHLVKSLRTCQNPYTCPHGRPTIIKLSQYEIERMFKRIV